VASFAAAAHGEREAIGLIFQLADDGQIIISRIAKGSAGAKHPAVRRGMALHAVNGQQVHSSVGSITVYDLAMQMIRQAWTRENGVVLTLAAEAHAPQQKHKHTRQPIITRVRSLSDITEEVDGEDHSPRRRRSSPLLVPGRRERNAGDVFSEPTGAPRVRVYISPLLSERQQQDQVELAQGRYTCGDDLKIVQFECSKYDRLPGLLPEVYP
jgi:hypothetical protein